MAYSGKSPDLDFEEGLNLFTDIFGLEFPFGRDRNPDVLESKTSYLRGLDNPDKIVQELRNLRDSGVEFDTIVGTGVSGMIPLLYVARELGIHWLAVRKPTEKSHTGLTAEGRLGRKWIFLDDFIDSGQTLRNVLQAVESATYHSGFHTQFVGVYSYAARPFRNGGKGEFQGTDVPSIQQIVNWAKKGRR